MTTPLICDFEDNGEKIKITNNWQVVRQRSLDEIEVLMVFNFSPQAPQIKITWDSERDKSKEQCINLLKRHPLIEVKGNTNLKKAIFRMTNSMDEKKKRVMDNKQKGIIFNMVNNMTGEQVRDVAFWNRVPNAHKMDIWDLSDALINFETGVLMRNQGLFFENIKVEGPNYRVFSEKAIALKVVAEREGFYYYDNTQLGKTTEDVMDFLMQNKDKFEYIKKDVLRLDKLPADWSKKTVLELIGVVPTVTEQLGETKAQQKKKEADELEEIKSKAKSLGIDRSWLKTKENLIAEITAKEKELAATTV